MTKWADTIDITYLHTLYTEGKLSVIQLGKGVGSKLKMLEAFHSSDLELLDIIMLFNSLDEYSDQKDYEVALDTLYTWADKDNRLYIEAQRQNQKLYILPAHTAQDVKTDTAPINTTPTTQPTITEPTITCENNLRGRVYAPNRTTNYMSEEDFNKKLDAHKIHPKSIVSPLYSYMKSSDPIYQSWLLERLKDHNLHLNEASVYKENENNGS
jgi:hypothetical protein